MLDIANPAQKQVIQKVLTPARDLIRGATKRSSSYASELEGKSFVEILKLSKSGGEVGKKASQMKKLIQEQERLLGKL